MRVTKAFYFNPDLIANHITECFGLDCGYTKHCTKLVQPAGAHLTPEQIAELILTDARTCGRVLYQLRDRSMAKFINLTNVE